MIRRLWRLNHTPWLVFAIIGFFAFVLGVVFGKHSEGPVFAFSTFPLWLGSTGKEGVNKKRYTVFEAALPIPARDLFLSFTVLPIVGFWIVMLAILAAMAVSHADALGTMLTHVLGFGSAMTLYPIALSCIRPDEAEPPTMRPLIIVGFVICVGVVALNGFALGVGHYGPRAWNLTAAICGACAIVLLADTLYKLPSSIQIAPRKARKPDSRENSFAGLFHLPASGWSVVLRCLSGAQFFVWAPFLCMFAFFGTRHMTVQLIEILFAILATWITLIRLKTDRPWLSSLPIRWHLVFLPVTLAPLAALAIGTAVHAYFSAQSVRASIVGLLIVEVASQLPGALIGLPSFAQRHRELWIKVRAYAFNAMLLMLLWAIVAAIGPGRIPIETWLDRTLPANPVLFAVTVLAIMAAALWIAYKGFSRMEVGPGGAQALASARRAASRGRWG